MNFSEGPWVPSEVPGQIRRINRPHRWKNTGVSPKSIIVRVDPVDQWIWKIGRLHSLGNREACVQGSLIKYGDLEFWKGCATLKHVEDEFMFYLPPKTENFTVFTLRSKIPWQFWVCVFVDLLRKEVSSSNFNSSVLELGIPLPNMKSTIKLRLETKFHSYFATNKYALSAKNQWFFGFFKAKT